MSEQLNNIKFVEEIEKHELLYNYNLPAYSRKDLTEKAWQEVAAKVNMTAVECKEKWRNLRTVFTRRLRTPPSGSGRNKKKYYLAEAMQFSVPYIKTLLPSSTGNLPEILQDEATEAHENADMIETEPDTLPEQSQSPPTPPPAEPILSTAKSFQMKNKVKLKNKSAIEADNSVAEYLKAKKARLEVSLSTTTSYKSERKEALKMFLLSLIPEVENFNDEQIKLFKRQIFNVIDDISQSTISTPSSSSATSASNSFEFCMNTKSESAFQDL